MGIKESKPQPKLINAAKSGEIKENSASSGEIKENSASSGEIKENCSEVKLRKSESLNEDVIMRQNELIERYSKKPVPLEQFSRHLLQRIAWNVAVMGQLFENSVASTKVSRLGKELKNQIKK